MLDIGLEGRPALGRNGFGLREERVVQFQGRFHIWVTIWVYGWLAIYLFS